MAETSLALFDKHRDGLLRALPAHVDADRFYAIALSTAATLRADVSERSVLLFCYGCAKLGLVPDATLGHVYAVPFKKQATLIVGYKGYIELARRSGRIGSVYADLIYDGESFDHWVDEGGPRIRHKPSLDRPMDPRNGCLGAYCIADVRGSWPSIMVIQRKTIDAVDLTDDPNPKRRQIWAQHWDEMAKKTAVRRASKFWPLTPELAQAVAWDEQADRGEQAIDMPEAPHAEDAQQPLSLTDGGELSDEERAEIEAAERGETY